MAQNDSALSGNSDRETGHMRRKLMDVREAHLAMAIQVRQSKSNIWQSVCGEIFAVTALTAKWDRGRRVFDNILCCEVEAGKVAKPSTWQQCSHRGFLAFWVFVVMVLYCTAYYEYFVRLSFVVIWKNRNLHLI